MKINDKNKYNKSSNPYIYYNKSILVTFTDKQWRILLNKKMSDREFMRLIKIRIDINNKNDFNNINNNIY